MRKFWKTVKVKKKSSIVQGEELEDNSEDESGLSSDDENYLQKFDEELTEDYILNCLLYTSPSPRDLSTSRMPSSA